MACSAPAWRSAGKRPQAVRGFGSSLTSGQAPPSICVSSAANLCNVGTMPSSVFSSRRSARAVSVRRSPLLLAARERGCTIHMGREMFIEMAPLYLSLFGYDGYASDGIRKLVGYKD